MLSSLWNFSKNFQGCITVYLSRFFVVTCFTRNSLILSCVFSFVNNFFWKFLIVKNLFFHSQTTTNLVGGFTSYHSCFQFSRHNSHFIKNIISTPFTNTIYSIFPLFYHKNKIDAPVRYIAANRCIWLVCLKSIQ